MKKIFFLFLLCLGITTAGYSQAAGKGSAEKGSGTKVKPRGQMRHRPHARRPDSDRVERRLRRAHDWSGHTGRGGDAFAGVVRDVGVNGVME